VMDFRHLNGRLISRRGFVRGCRKALVVIDGAKCTPAYEGGSKGPLFLFLKEKLNEIQM